MSDSDRAVDAAQMRTPTNSGGGNRISAQADAGASASGASVRRQRGKRKRSRNNDGSETTSPRANPGAGDGSDAFSTPQPPTKRKAGSDRSSSAASASAAATPATTDATENDDDDAQWGCPACTFLNDAMRSFCEMCGTTNPHPKRVGRGAGVLGALFAGSPDATAPWSCVACTMTNAPGSRACAVCGTVNPQASMHSALTIARRSLTGSGLLSDAIDVDESSDSDDDDDDDDSSSDSDTSNAAAGNDRTWTCAACASAERIPASAAACPVCAAARPLHRKSPLKAPHRRDTKKLQKAANALAAATGSAKKPTKSAYGVSSDVLRQLALEPTSSKLIDTLQTLTHTLAMLDASADAEWGGGGDMRSASLFMRGFGASSAGTTTGVKEPALLDVLSDIFSQKLRNYPIGVRLLAVQSINYVLKMDRHVFPRAAVLAIVELYLTDLLQWTSDSTVDNAKHRSTQMVVEECLSGVASVCATDSAALRIVTRTDRLSAFVDFVARLTTSDSSSVHTSIVATALELLQKCCVRMRWRSCAATSTGSSGTSRRASTAAAAAAPSTPVKKSNKKTGRTTAATARATPSPVKAQRSKPLDTTSDMTLALAIQVVALLRQTLQHKHVPLHVQAAKCLLVVCRRVPLTQQPDAMTTLLPSDVLQEFVAVVTNASGAESEESRHAMLALLFQLFDNRPSLVSLFVQQQLYVPLLDGVLPLLQSTSSSLGAAALKLTALLARLVCRKHSTSAVDATATAAAAATSDCAPLRARLNSAPDPNVVATLLVDFIRADSIAAVSALLKDGADLNFPQLLDINGSEIDKPLHIAAACASLAMVKYLVKHGADVHQTGKGGTALHVAAKSGRCDVVSFLLQCGASIHMVDRDGKSVLAALASVSDSSTSNASDLPSPVQRMLESHQRALDADDNSDHSDEDDGDGDHARARSWFFADGDDEDDEMDDDEMNEEEEDDEDDDAYYMHGYDDEDEDDEEYDAFNHYDDDDDDEMRSDDDADDDDANCAAAARLDATSDARSDYASKPTPPRASTKQRIDSVASETERATPATTAGVLLSPHVDCRERDALLRRQGVVATPSEIYGFSHALLHCLLAVLNDMDIQNVARSVLSTLACVLEMAPSQLVQSLSDHDVVLVLDMVHFLLQGQKLDAQALGSSTATSAAAAAIDEQHAPLSSARQNERKANLSSFILALRILQAIVRKSTANASIFYQIERRGICEQIELVNATSTNWLAATSDNSSVQPPPRTTTTTIFKRSVELLETLRANMMESGMLHLHKLKNLARRMRAISDDSTADERELAVLDLVELFEQPNAITTYEFKQSELLPAVLAFLAPHQCLNANRAKLLVRAFQRFPDGLKHLVFRLQSIVTHEETFSVVSFNPGRGRELYPLTRQLKIRFARVPSSTNGPAAASNRRDEQEEEDDVRIAAAGWEALPTPSKTIHSSPLTHFQSLERTVARCLAVHDAKLLQLYASLVGHCVQKAIDGKWKKFTICGFDATRSLHLLKPVGGRDDDVVEVVLHDSQFKLTGSVGVYTNVCVSSLELFGAVVPPSASLSDTSSSNTNATDSMKQRKAASKRKRKLSGTRAQDVDVDDAQQPSLCDVEVCNERPLDFGPFPGAWYAAALVSLSPSLSSVSGTSKSKATKPSKFEALVKPQGVYTVRLLHSKRVVPNVPAAALRKRLATPQVGSVVQVDGALGEVTCVNGAERSSVPLIDVKVNNDVEKVRVKKERIQYPPPPAATATTTTTTTTADDDDADDSSSRIEAMSMRRMFPPRESSMLAGAVGDRVWIRAPAAGSASSPLDLYVAATIDSFPSGLESIRDASTVVVAIASRLDQLTPSPRVLLKVQQAQVVNFVNGSRRGGAIGGGAGGSGSRLLAALQMASNRAGGGGGSDRLFGNDPNSALHRAFQQATDSMRPGGRDDTSGSGAMDQLRQLISRVSRSSGVGSSSDVDVRSLEAAPPLLSDATPQLALVASTVTTAPSIGSSSAIVTSANTSVELPRLDDATDVPSTTPSRTSSPVARRPLAQKRPDESVRNDAVWEHLVCDSSDCEAPPAWICTTAPKVNLCLAYHGRESSDASPLDLSMAASRSGATSAGRHAAALLSSKSSHATEEHRTRTLLFGTSHPRTLPTECAELTLRMQAILLDVFKTFEPTAMATRTPSPKKKKRKLSATATAALTSDATLDVASVADMLWDIDRFSAFMKRCLAWPKPSVRYGGDSSVEQCVLFSKFASLASNRRGLAFDGFVALLTSFCKEPAKATLVLKYVRSLGYTDAHLAAGDGRDAKQTSRPATASSSSNAASAAAVASEVVDDAPTPVLRQFPADQNVLKCLQELQSDDAAASGSTQVALPPWKYVYKVQCDYRVDWSVDASPTAAATTATATSSDPTNKSSQSVRSEPQHIRDVVALRSDNARPNHVDTNAFEWLDTATTTTTTTTTTSVASAVRLLYYLFELTATSSSSAAAVVADDVWTNPRLYNKLEAQLQDVLSVCCGIYPTWCDQIVTQCRFFFPRALREQLFRATAFGCTRSLYWYRTYLQVDESAPNSDSVGGTSSSGMIGASSSSGVGILNHEISITPIPKERVKVHRANILNSAEAVMKMHAKRRAILDIVFVGEKGYGSGVTAAFYSATALALQSVDENARKRLWVAGDEDAAPPAMSTTRSGDSIGGDDAVIRHPNGLFPFPHAKPHARLLERFRMMGRLAGKAIMDERLLPLPLAPQFMQLVVGERFAIDEIAAIFQSPGKILLSLHAAAQQLASGASAASVQIDGMALDVWLEAVAFTFVEPLSQEPLVPNGDNVVVTVANVRAYVDCVLQRWLADGIEAQVLAFRDGVRDVLPLAKLQLLFVPELLAMLCGDADVQWDTESLRKTLKLAHGYTSASAPVQHFIEFLDEMSGSERRAFLLYATGCPNLPPGGFAALKPGFEVVRRVIETDDVDRALPFARTCTNTLHLPAYSSKDALTRQMRFAIANSRGVIDRD